MIRLCQLGFVLSILIAVAAEAQIVPPPRQDTQSATGVSFRSGAFSFEETDLSIGPGLPQGLSLKRSYNSTMTAAGGLPRGWTHSLIGYVKGVPIPQDPDAPSQLPAYRVPYIYNVSVGGKSVGFIGGSKPSATMSTGGPVGNYTPVSPSGASLVFNGADLSGYYTFTDGDGTIVNFKQYTVGTIANWTFPDGTYIDMSNSSFVTSSRGYAIIFESASKTCIVNRAFSSVVAGSACPPEAPAVTYTFATGAFANVLSSATKGGETTTYGYDSADHISCITMPGQSVCNISNQYTACPPDPDKRIYAPQIRLHDGISNQQEASGNRISYTFQSNSCLAVKGQAYYPKDYRPEISNTATMINSLSERIVVVTSSAGLPESVQDPLSRTKNLSYLLNSLYAIEPTQLQSISYPEGNYDAFEYDARGNIITRRVGAKPGSGNPDLISRASFPTVCTAIKSCNKLDYFIDANGNQTDHSYSPDHGGVLLEMGPADPSGIRPVKRYAYVQRYAWFFNGSGGYVRGSAPIWLLATQKTCRTTATSGDGCAGGPADEVVTAYEYGPDAGPNNLFLRGVAITADGTTQRTCYSYDYSGNKISETKPRAGLGSCL